MNQGLNVKAVNGPKGKTIFLVLNSKPDAPVAITNRVVPGAVLGSSGSFGFRVRFVDTSGAKQSVTSESRAKC